MQEVVNNMLFVIFMIISVIFVFCYFYYHFYTLVPFLKYRRIGTICIILLIFLFMICSRMFFGLTIHFIIALILMDLFYIVMKKTRCQKYIHREIIAIVIASLLSGYGYMNTQNIHYVQYDITIDKQFEDTRFLAVSDLHIGTAIDVNDLDKIKNKAKERDVDAILILGDLFDESTSYDEGKEAIAFFDQLTCDYPIYYIEGNHDINQGFKIQEKNRELVDLLSQSRVTVLQDEMVSFHQIQLIGRLDKSDSDRQDMKALMKEVDLSKPIIVLDHQPVELQKKAALGTDVELSGHTHNGQIWPLGMICRLFHINELEYGYQKTNQMHTIVSSGMGAWGFAMRSEGHSEMIEINVISR